MKNKKTEISVCIPTYGMKGRGAEFLAHSFNMLSSQTFQNFEVVVSDHDDTNSIKKLCDEWDDLKIHYFRNKDIGNSSANINNAICNAESPIIKILFQDDYLYTDDALEKIYRMHLLGASWCVSGCYHTEDGINVNRPMIPEYHEDIHLGRNTISSPSVVSFMKENCAYFDETLVWLMDCDFYKAMRNRNGLPTIIEDPLVVNRLWENSYTNQMQQERKDFEFKYVKMKYENGNL